MHQQNLNRARAETDFIVHAVVLVLQEIYWIYLNAPEQSLVNHLQLRYRILGPIYSCSAPVRCVTTSAMGGSDRIGHPPIDVLVNGVKSGRVMEQSLLRSLSTAILGQDSLFTVPCWPPGAD